MNTETEFREGLDELAEHYTEVLKLLGEDPEREGLVKTPMRVAKAMQSYADTDSWLYTGCTQGIDRCPLRREIQPDGHRERY